MSTLPLHCCVRAGDPQAIWFADGNAVHLHRVDTLAARAAYLRALRTARGWIVFDITRVAPALLWDLPNAPERDVAGLVLHSLRGACTSVPDFLAAAELATDAALTRMVNVPTGPAVTTPAKVPLARQVTAFFTANPDEELTIGDIAVKFSTSARTVQSKLAHLVGQRVLARDDITYRAGTALQSKEA
jgi:hypothetical protein